MSLQQKCLQLRTELYQLKRKAREPKETTACTYSSSHKELGNIVFGSKPVKRIPKSRKESPLNLTFNHNESIEDSSFDANEVSKNLNSSFTQKKNEIREEITQIKRLENIPMRYISPVKKQTKYEEDDDAPIKLTQILESVNKNENLPLKRTIPLIPKSTIAKNTSFNKMQTLGKKNVQKEDFAETCKKIYDQKKDMSETKSKVRDLILQNRINYML